ncbi:MAG: DUF4136 domain-containing protein [Rubrivivax sp.]
MNRPLLIAIVPAVLCGCAVTQLDANVHTQGAWPGGRAPGTFAFQRLPSQQIDVKEQDKIEADAQPALERAGFKPAPNGTPDVLVQLARRSGQSGGYPGPIVGFTPYGFGGVYGGGWRGAGWGYGAGWAFAPYDFAPVYFSEVAVLIVDAQSQATLYESRARTDIYAGDRQLWSALFEAALRDFPYNAVSPRQVVVQLLPPQAPPQAAASAPR